MRPTVLVTRRARRRETGGRLDNMQKQEMGETEWSDVLTAVPAARTTTRRHDDEAVRLVAPASRGVRMRDPGNTSQPAADSACVSRISHPHTPRSGGNQPTTSGIVAIRRSQETSCPSCRRVRRDGAPAPFLPFSLLLVCGLTTASTPQPYAPSFGSKQRRQRASYVP